MMTVKLLSKTMRAIMMKRHKNSMRTVLYFTIEEIINSDK